MSSLDDLLKPAPGTMSVQPVCETMWTQFGFDVTAIPGANGSVQGYKLTFVGGDNHLQSYVFDPLGWANFKGKLQINGGG